MAIITVVTVAALISCSKPEASTEPSASPEQRPTSTTMAAPDSSPRETENSPAPGDDQPPEEREVATDQAGRASPTSPATTQSGQPPAVTPPRSGTYTYRTSTDGRRSETTVQVENGDRNDGERRQTITRKGEDGQRESEVVWRIDGMHVRRTTTSNPQATCDWEPDFRHLALPLDHGASWRYSTTCETQLGPAPITVTREGHFTVHGPVLVRVASAEVETWEIRGTEKQTVSGAFNGNSTDESITYYSPAHGLEVRSTHTITGTSPQGTTTTTVENEITNLDPTQ